MTIPSNQTEISLIKMTVENAALHFSQLWTKVETSEALELLKESLNLSKIPMRIEGFDIANILGKYSVASVISFFGGKPDKENYRRMKIRSKDSPDDFAMIYEAVSRRYSRLIKEKEKKELPDLIVIDGGKGQLNAALKALNELKVDIPTIALAKEEEEIFLPDKENSVKLPKNSPALHIIQQIRDETHRFANQYFNKLKIKSDFLSIFDNIKGIGKKRKEIIMQKFLNYDIIKELKLEDLIKEGIPKNEANNVLTMLKNLLGKRENR